MSTHRPPYPNAVKLRVSALLGLGLLAGCTSGGSVHLDITAKSPNGTEAFSDDATASGGRQVITFEGTGNATILLIDGVDYVQADAATLQGFFQASPQQAVQAAGQWISVRQGEKLPLTAPANAVPASSITSGSILTEFPAEA